MGGIGKRVIVLGLVVSAALIAGMAWNLLETQRQGRASLRDGFERRAALTGKLIGNAFLASSTPEAAAQKYGGSPRSVRRLLVEQSAAGANQRLMVLDARGDVIASTSDAVSGNGALLARSPHLQTALGGVPALSDAFRDETSKQVLEIAIPFDTPTGRRVLAGTGPIEIVQNFTGNLFASASALPGAKGYLIDGERNTLSATGAGGAGPRPEPPAALAAALERRETGTFGVSTFVSAGVPNSRWRVVLTVPTRTLYASIDGGPSAAAWRLFAAFSAAICALLALGFAAVRGARRLAAASEREHAAQHLAHARLHDALTGLPNRALFQDRADRAIATARRQKRSVAVLFLDVDNFKRINDSLGHEAGDTVLREVAHRLRDSVRETDTVSRFGGDEFVVLYEDIEPEALRLVTRIQEAFDEPIVVDGRQIPASVSIGLAVHTGVDDMRPASELLRNADQAMYRAKDLGRGRVEIFNGDLHEQALARLETEMALRQALAGEEFVLHYQPIVALPTGDIHAVEALVRWRHEATGELVPPAQFIPLAEETGMITQIGAWVLRTAVMEIGSWADRGLVPDDFQLYVNISARQLADPELADTVADALTAWNRPASRLCLEITETAVALDPVIAERTLEQLSALGVLLALDDFGAGYSSLGQLARSLPISVLKLDRSFVAGMDRRRDRGIVQAAASLARALEMTSIAEGVETAEQASLLGAMGFPYAQGFHFARPADANTIVQLFGGSTTAETVGR